MVNFNANFYGENSSKNKPTRHEIEKATKAFLKGKGVIEKIEYNSYEEIDQNTMGKKRKRSAGCFKSKQLNRN